MAQVVEYNGQNIEFPDGMSPDAMQAALKANAMSLSGKPAEAPQRAPLTGFTAAAIPQFARNLGNMLAGGAREAGGIGATLLAPIDAAARAMNGGQPINVGGYDIAGQDRRAAMDSALAGMGADPESLQYKGGAMATGIAGTAGVGNAITAPLKIASKVLPAASKFIDPVASAIQTGGFRLGADLPAVVSAPLRVAGGVINGGATAGLINPDDAGMGAMIGGAMPVAARAAGWLGSMFHSAAPDLTPQMRDTLTKAIDAGYVVPPASVNPTFTNRALESASGKMATQQLASVQNQDTTTSILKNALGIAQNEPLDQAALRTIRDKASAPYKAVASLPPSDVVPNPAQALEELKQARNDAQGWFNAYNRSASPADLAKAKEASALAQQIETNFDYHAVASGQPQLIPQLQDARKLIAQSYTVGRALNDATGSIDASVLAKMYRKGVPLSDGLDTVGQFAAGFPTVNKLPEKIGSPDAHNLKSIASLMLGTGGHIAAGPLGMTAAALPWAMAPAARAVMFSKAAQRGLLAMPAAETPMGLLATSAYRSVPLLATQGE